MFDELYATERSIALAHQVQRPDPVPQVGTFSGFGSALADSLPSAALTAASSWTALLDAFGKTQAYANAPTVAMMHNQAQPDLDQLKADTIGQLFNSPDAAAFRESAKRFAPDPLAVGTAGQIVHGLVSGLGKAVAYTAAAGPAAPLLFGGDMGINRAQELTDQGVDAGTAAGAGVVTGVTSGAMLMLPPALGATRLQSAAIGAAVNPAIGIAERGTIHALLEHADYPKIAAQYKPFDPMQLAVEALSGAAFGGAFHSTKAREGAMLTPEQHAATLVMNEVRARDSDFLTKPGDIVAAGQAHDAQLLARGQMDAGEPVSVAHGINVDQALVAQKVKTISESDFFKSQGIDYGINPQLTEKFRNDISWSDGQTDPVTGFPTWKSKHVELAEPKDVTDSHDVFYKPLDNERAVKYEIRDAAGNKVGHTVLEMKDGWPTMLLDIEVDPKLRGKQYAERTVAAIANDAGELKIWHIQDSARSWWDRQGTAPTDEHNGSLTFDAYANARAGRENARSLEGGVKSVSELDQVREKTSRQEIAQPGATPELTYAREHIAANPDAVIRMDDGTEVRAADALKAADDEVARATSDAAGFQAAIACALRFGS